jgi:hypothetical protein
MKLSDRINVEDWLQDIWTTPALDNSDHIGCTLALVLRHYFRNNGCDAKTIVEVMKQLGTIFEALRLQAITKGGTDVFKEFVE